MYAVMTRPVKDERIEIRVPSDIKEHAQVVAEMRRWNLTQLIVDLLDGEIKAARTNSGAAFDDAAKRLREAAKPKTPKTSRPVVTLRGKGNGRRRGNG